MKRRAGNLFLGLLLFCGCEKDAPPASSAIPAPAAAPRVEAPSTSVTPSDQPLSPPPLPVSGSTFARSFEEPAASQPASAPSVPAFEPLRDAKPGEWALYDSLDRRTLRYEVAEADIDRVQTRVIATEQGKPLGKPAMREDGRDYDPVARQARRSGAAQSIGIDTIDAAGRSWKASLYQEHWTDEGVAYVRRTWVSADVPAFGIIRTELEGNGVMEARLTLREFGSTGARQ